jgi:hypothetical protein
MHSTRLRLPFTTATLQGCVTEHPQSPNPATAYTKHQYRAIHHPNKEPEHTSTFSQREPQQPWDVLKTKLKNWPRTNHTSLLYTQLLLCTRKPVAPDLVSNSFWPKKPSCCCTPALLSCCCPCLTQLLLLHRALQEPSVVMVCMPKVHVCVSTMCAMVMCIRHHGQQGNGTHPQQQHRKLGPAGKGLGDVGPAADARAAARSNSSK